MRRVMTMLATALLASNLLTAVAEAHVSGGGGHMGGFGGAGHIRGFDGAYLGGIGRMEGLGGVHVEGMVTGDHGLAFHDHSMHRGFRAGYGTQPTCDYPDELSKYPPWPPYCS